MVKKYYIKTFGCQMNVYDSNRMAVMLEEMGLKKTQNQHDADDVKKSFRIWGVPI